MADEKSHTEEGQIARANRLRQVIENLKEGGPETPSSDKPESLKEQIAERARQADRSKKASRSK